MKWFKENWFRVGILILGIIIVFILVDKQIKFPENEREKSTSKDRQCSISGKQWLGEYKKLNDINTDQGYIDAQYNYNNEDERCYVRLAIFDGSSTGYVRHHFYDVYNNSELYFSVVRLEPDDVNRTNKRIYQSGLSEDEFFEKTDILMSVIEP